MEALDRGVTFQERTEIKCLDLAVGAVAGEHRTSSPCQSQQWLMTPLCASRWEGFGTDKARSAARIVGMVCEEVLRSTSRI